MLQNKTSCDSLRVSQDARPPKRAKLCDINRRPARRSRRLRRMTLAMGMPPLLSAVPDDVVVVIMRHLGAPGAVALRSTSQRLLRLADSDSVWVPLLQALWEGKVYVPLWLREWRADPAIDARRAYILSLQDARRAQYTSGEELCSLVFEFCFKEEAGEYWTSKDPSHRAEPPMLRQFCDDATIAPRGGPARLARDPLISDPEILDWLPEIRWRFTKSQHGSRGQYVQVNRWPSAAISRDPHTWAWRMESQWVTYTSIPWPER